MSGKVIGAIEVMASVIEVCAKNDPSRSKACRSSG